MTNLPLSPIVQAAQIIARRHPAVLAHLSRETKIAFAIKADISKINAEYHDAISEALIEYFEGGSITAPRNAFKRAMIQAFGDAFDAGWIDGGGELPVDDDALAWIEERLNQEAANIDALFQQAKDLRKDPDFFYFSWITARADMYTQTAGSAYNAAKLLADERQMLVWHLGNTEESCDTCIKLNGKKHRASWYIERDYIPRKPGANLTCQGYNCDCYLTDKDGNEVTI